MRQAENIAGRALTENVSYGEGGLRACRDEAELLNTLPRQRCKSIQRARQHGEVAARRYGEHAAVRGGVMAYVAAVLIRHAEEGRGRVLRGCGGRCIVRLCAGLVRAAVRVLYRAVFPAAAVAPYPSVGVQT